ncbi:MAG TPA: HEPN domain-containing protein [Dehalococcoidia bacterium]|nr:HEPN domain-containing protein [Dehalococcoidia bacterium]
MNRREFQQLAFVRQREAKALLDRRLYDGAYYLAGYAVECALKACIAKQTRRFEFPDRDWAIKVFTHDLRSLMRSAQLEEALAVESTADQIFGRYWALVCDWRETSRYERHTAEAARTMFDAINDPTHGVLRWLRLHW